MAVSAGVAAGAPVGRGDAAADPALRLAIAEATGRATMFLGAVSGGPVALGLIATATDVGAAFYAFGLLLLPTLALWGW